MSCGGKVRIIVTLEQVARICEVHARTMTRGATMRLTILCLLGFSAAALKSPRPRLAVRVLHVGRAQLL